ncbi:MAG: NAD(P)-dependent oxidoreductase, partial [Thermomicrobiales bacterium]|nr:NAD(P)-dependent oxidoreductase [Thermomicrobiales bacterium]
ETTGSAMRRVMVTGAAGGVAGRLRRLMPGLYPEIVWSDRAPLPDPRPDETFLQLDLADAGAVERGLEGVDGIVHLGGASIEKPWETILEANIVGCYNLFEAARRAGAPRIVFASTNHVMGMYDRDGMWPIFADQPIRPDSLYGVSKAFGEALGRFWYDQHGVSVICLRIGWMLPEPHDEIARWMWLSPRDCAQLVSRAIESDVGFDIVYAISQNASRRWDITKTIEHFGYRPQDDAEGQFVAPDQAATGNEA